MSSASSGCAARRLAPTRGRPRLRVGAAARRCSARPHDASPPASCCAIGCRRSDGQPQHLCGALRPVRRGAQARQPGHCRAHGVRGRPPIVGPYPPLQHSPSGGAAARRLRRGGRCSRPHREGGVCGSSRSSGPGRAWCHLGSITRKDLLPIAPRAGPRGHESDGLRALPFRDGSARPLGPPGQLVSPGVSQEPLKGRRARSRPSHSPRSGHSVSPCLPLGSVRTPPVPADDLTGAAELVRAA